MKMEPLLVCVVFNLHSLFRRRVEAKLDMQFRRSRQEVPQT